MYGDLRTVTDWDVSPLIQAEDLVANFFPKKLLELDSFLKVRDIFPPEFLWVLGLVFLGNGMNCVESVLFCTGGTLISCS